MKKVIIAGLFAFSSLAAFNSYADSSDQDVVVDKNGNPVISSLSGECVLTKWKNTSNRCGGDEATPAPMVEKVMPIRNERAVRMVEKNRSYIVFFDFDKSNLTAAGQEIVGTLYNDSNGAGRVSFNLIGHADRSGSDAYNMKLSEKRAQAVKNELVRLGADSSDIELSWKGESEPLVKTDDGIKEPQNRRTEVKIRLSVEEK